MDQLSQPILHRDCIRDRMSEVQSRWIQSIRTHEREEHARLKAASAPGVRVAVAKYKFRSTHPPFPKI